MYCPHHAEALEYKKEALVRDIHTISEMVKGGEQLHLQERMEMPRERPEKVSFACGLLAIICILIGLFGYCLTCCCCCCCCCSDPDDLFDEDHRE
ncbi:hypothetical protein ACE6H2_026291 [Prunus campanulata]